MEEHFFHIYPDQIEQDQFTLSEKESRHFCKSLRGNVGDNLWLLDGIGTAFEGVVLEINGGSVSGRIQNSIPNYGESKFSIHLAIGLIKGSRMDMVLEKVTEMGVHSIQPLFLDRCVKNKLNMDRANRIVISAAKQAGRSLFPKIFEPINLSEWLKKHSNEHKILCHMFGNQSMADALGSENKTVCLIIGPEGDFSESEMDKMKEANVEFALLGPRRLRSESAAMVAVSNLNQLMEVQR
ncbi:MAG: 16S rRNA (uracil(1498)-N(3))-methyltransferase [Candidatus Marinimicrobia bacterium]|jgi:16S rRNA (uracil1498-N3)-methyltransferase|nr:16S rRNA (uracil(1498)-N(3))-methyltransferase [Candidatus Neomarinimicrobiota bacterium]MBT3676425.1 16S rRNA (uracil(1498)-N(3))-methyltransferase [Candidatus Neomarinimicrobiota bacterium]MBT3763771.1 16S rRNA (uracil(1498)-N(3))-methyltransferase [Candidatus Neomarinimicrobiota bacterium]MBT4067108.1 16S rRNA (uracil(1498)-N(3))-methyltransferase [Candidatus Neomarinimicrobiota bacterium]MBT4270046.1 16S rRNA (uracil(1498)-N(3))-methyltransferase [Candidatus Neomarinimicrobiota bacterium